MSRYKGMRRKKARINYKRLIASITVVVVIIGGIFLIGSGTLGKLLDDADADSGKKPVMTAANQDPERNRLFEEYYFYEEDKKERYEKYAEQNPDMTTDDVVWRVNAGLDRPFYTNIQEIRDYVQIPLLVNKYHKLPDDYAPSDLVKTSSGKEMTADTKYAYEQMRDAAGAAGCRINVASAYRSIEYQKGLYNRYILEDSKKEIVDTYSARAGHSEHHTGRALDLVGPGGSLESFGNSEEAEWIREHAWEYGFIVRYTEENTDITGYISEPWHITFVGTWASGIMHEKGISSLEEYMVKYIDHCPPELQTQ